ncbi:MAG: polyphosphate kinase 2 [Rhodobacter sp.]|uniref:polyphosphate kinase 2 n=1 Tax=Pararhodobacter sp. TaxID=2127056 RepID=UPI001D4EE6D6|nr:polyphosphate kinase 2 [Pararhodobacter sp.]MCB1344363.1 polyphosphate kinase 2 [Paracoccaceae bacterium]MCC0074646.1 polyphosphate kinase 2 [Rhodobacter sp.]HPD92927.1 polyphosphate kinase 2 [Pararhodobacter sp.]
MDLPFDGAISAYFEKDAPERVRAAIEDGRKRDILTDDFPYDRWMKQDDYEDRMKPLQVELVKLQRWIEASGERVVVVFEGRDTAGKSGAIKRVRENLNPRGARIVALPKPTEREATQWYFQRYIAHMPAAGEIALLDRSWYNRGVVEHVFGFCTPAQRAHFFDQLPGFEQALVNDGIRVIKLWFNVGRAEQLRRMLERERHVLKQWKLSSIDVKGLAKWDAYTEAIGETFARSNFPYAPWTVIRGDDKYRARLAAVQQILRSFDYAGKNPQALGAIDTAIMGGVELWPKG